MSRPIKSEEWHLPVAQLMARTGCGLKEACSELEIDVTGDECALLVRRASFIRLVWQERHRYFTDLARSPDFGQDTVVGKLLNLAQKLEDEGEIDKSAEVLLKLSKIRGWVGVENQVNILGDLTQGDLDRIRKTLEGKKVSANVN
jgi:hypothetical protein